MGRAPPEPCSAVPGSQRRGPEVSTKLKLASHSGSSMSLLWGQRKVRAFAEAAGTIVSLVSNNHPLVGPLLLCHS